MIKKTLYFGNPAYLSLRNAQLVIKLPEVEKCPSLPEAMKRQSEITKPIEDIGVVILDNKQITITSGAIEALLENNCALITCDSKSMPVGLYNPQIQISAESETKRSIFREKDKTKRSKKESAQHSKSRNKSFVMTSVSAL